MESIFWDSFSIVAVLFFCCVLLIKILQLLNILYVYFIAELIFGPTNFQKRYGEWAVVTGGSDGIGKMYARELAQRKINVVLISNVEADLQIVSSNLESIFGVQTRTILADFSLGEEEYQRIFSKIEDLNISILINNVGVSLGLPNLLEKMTRAQIWTMMMVNVCTFVAMTHHFLPKMKSQGKGLIVNVASATSMQPAPFANLYGSSKVFIRNFSRALAIECKGTGVEVQTLIPSFVNTKLCLTGKQTSFLVPSPEKFAASAVATVGFSNYVAGYWPHELQCWAVRLTPKWLVIKITTFLLSFADKDKMCSPSKFEEVCINHI